MKLHFESDLPHQADAVAAVLQRFDARFRRPRAVAGPGGMPLVANADVAAATIPDLGVEMETGTGKTYVFVRTALELAAQRGVTKFIVVVPTVAIREGVLKTLQVTREHFSELYPRVPYRFFAYDRARLHRLGRFVRSTNVDFMVLTIDAFNKASNVLRQSADRFGGATPVEVLAACRPVLIVDEPHHLESPLSIASLSDLRPLCVLRYGATHRRSHGIVHRLTPAQAHARGLVKTIEVVACEVAEPLEARFSAQIKATIAAHLERQATLRSRGIKVLSLFFVDRVASYTGEDAVVRRLFDEHYAALAGESAEPVRAAYFASRGKGSVDTTTGRSAADAAAYALIMRDKERLLSLTEPVAFIFSHSALREGWDNPNVFQICTLARSVSAVKKRQEIGRGIRLCVDGAGRRVLDPDVNVLQVFANSSYEAYVGALQSEDAAVAEELRGPVPRRVGAGNRAVVEERAVAWPARVDVDRLVAATVRRVGGALVAGEGDPQRLLDLVEARLFSGTPACPLSRPTVVRVLDALPRVADPPGAAGIIAEAIRESLAGG